MRRAKGLGGLSLVLWVLCGAVNASAQSNPEGPGEQPPVVPVQERLEAQSTKSAPTPAEEPGPDADVKTRQAYWFTAKLAPAVPPPGLERKPPLGDRDRRNKRSQKPFAVIGVPQLGGNPDMGFIVGAVTALTWYGDPKEEPFYDYSAYKRQIIAQAQIGLRKAPNVLGRQNYILRYAAPYMNRTLFSFVADLSYEADVSAWYFGSNADTMKSLRQIGPDNARFLNQSFGTYNDYQSELRTIDVDSNGVRVSYATYNNYQFRQPRLLSSLKVDLFGGILTPSLTATAAYVDITTYDGKKVRGRDEMGTGRSLPTKLDEDCLSGVAKHCDGGFNNTLKLSVALDTRDFPVDANRGVLIDLSLETAKKFFGSVGDYNRATLSGSGYLNPFLMAGVDTRWTQLVLAGRVLYSVQGGDTPFFVRNQLAFIDRNVGGLGGINTMRGYRANRFVGNVTALGNFELRYDFYSFNTKRSTISFKLVPFVDVGRVFDRVKDTSLKDYRADVGSGIHLQWNQTNVIRADVGVGGEGTSFGVNYGMLF